MKKLLLSLLVCSVLSSTVAQPVWAGSDQLVVYSGRSDRLLKPVINAFEEATGIKVILHTASSTALLNRLKLEGKRTRADLYLSNDAGNLQMGSDMGLFAALPDEVLTDIADNYRAQDNTWVGLSARARTIVINTNNVAADNITSVFDLSKPEFKNRIGITTATNGSFIAGVTVYMEAAGIAKTRLWLQGLAANAGNNYFNKHSKIVAAVAAGKIDVGLVNHYYVLRHLAKYPDAPIRLIMPDSKPENIGVAWNVSGIALSKYAPNRAHALALIVFMLSRDGQQIFADANKEYPVRSDVEAVAALPKRHSFKVADVSLALLGKKRIATMDLIDEVGLP